MAKTTVYLIQKGKNKEYSLNAEGKVIKKVVVELPKGWKVVPGLEEGQQAISTASGKTVYYQITNGKGENGEPLPAIMMGAKYDILGLKYLKIV